MSFTTEVITINNIKYFCKNRVCVLPEGIKTIFAEAIDCLEDFESVEFPSTFESVIDSRLLLFVDFNINHKVHVNKIIINGNYNLTNLSNYFDFNIIERN